MKIVLLIAIFISFSIKAEEVCVDKVKLDSHIMMKEFQAENSAKILHNIEKISLIKMFIGDLDGRGTQEQYEVYDRLVELFISSIVTTINYGNKSGIAFDLYENRLSSDVLDYISSNSKLFPKTKNSEDFILLRAEINKLRGKP